MSRAKRKRGYTLSIERSDKMRGSTYRIGQDDKSEAKENATKEGAPSAPVRRSRKASVDVPARRAGVMARRPSLAKVALTKVALAKVGGREAERGAAGNSRSPQGRDRGSREQRHRAPSPAMAAIIWAGSRPPICRRWLLLRLLAYRIQAAALGDLGRIAVCAFFASPGATALQDSDGRSFAARAPVTARRGRSATGGAVWRANGRAGWSG